MCTENHILKTTGKLFGENQDGMNKAVGQDNSFSELKMTLKEVGTQNQNNIPTDLKITEISIKQEPIEEEEQTRECNTDNVIIKTEISTCLDQQMNREYIETMNIDCIKNESIDIDDYETPGKYMYINTCTGEEEKVEVKQEFSLSKEDTSTGTTLFETNTAKEQESVMKIEIKEESPCLIDLINKIKVEIDDTAVADSSVNREKVNNDFEKEVDDDSYVNKEEIEKSHPKKESEFRIIDSALLPNQPDADHPGVFEKETTASEYSLVDQQLSLLNSNEGRSCVVCGKSFNRISTFKSHILHHVKDFPHECKLCSERFKFLYELRSHKLIHGGKKSKCNVHHTPLKNHSYLKKTSVSHKFKRNVCNRIVDKYVYKEEMGHRRAKHYRCTICGEIFKFKLTLTNHLKTHRPDKSQKHNTSHNILKNPSVSQVNIVHFECKICKIAFKSSKSLTTHLHKHKLYGSQIQECKLCNKKFPTLEQLQKHIQVHVDMCPYECKICSKKFTCSYTFKEHTDIHKNEELRECKMCKSTFLDSRSLRLHICVISAVILFKCEICNEKFVDEDALEQHAKCHISQYYECILCNKKCKNLTILKRHIHIHTDE